MMSGIHRLAMGPVAALALLLWGAAAGQPAKDKATSLAKAGVVLLEEGKLDAALELFEKAYGLDPAPVLLGHMAKVHERKGDLRKARELYEKWVSAETDPDRLARAKARLADLLERIPGTIVVTTVPAGAVVTVDGRAVAAGVAVELAAGMHEVKATLAGHAPAKRTVEVAPGNETAVTLELAALPGRLQVRGGPLGAMVAVDGRESSMLPLQGPIVLSAGRHVVEVTAPGYERMVRTVEIGPDAAVTVDAELAVLPRPVAAPAIREGVTRPAEARSSAWPWVCIGTGGAALAAGAVMTGLAYLERSTVSHASRAGDVVTGMTLTDAASHVDRARQYDRAGWGLYAVGGAAVVTGVVLWLVSPTESAGNDIRVLAVTPVPGGGAASAGWGF